MKRPAHSTRFTRSMLLGVAVATTPIAALHAQDNASQIRQGFAISPVPLNLMGKNPALVGLGSYIVNTGGCNDCHTNPSFAPGGDPYLGQLEQINVAEFMAGGRLFPPSPFKSANLTPDATGKPAGLTLDQFIQTMRTGHNPLDPPGSLLQIMPWPAFGKKTDRDLRAIYEYLSAIPPLPDNPNPSPIP
ncbi:cytochrome C [Dyella ginsengisoli]|uniref:Cytochrome C n=1 Tax=Dyella ginsengisoli TaxID=363848 RepID=A0ABW8JVW4_9GAMM